MSASTVHAGRLEELLDLYSNDLERLKAELAQFARAGTPIVEGSRVTFLVNSPDGTEPRLLTEANWYGRYPEATGIAGDRMKAIAGTSWYFASIDLEPDARLEYTYASRVGEEWVDPNNPHRVVTFGSERSVVEMTGWRASAWVVDGKASEELSGELRRFEYDSSRFELVRSVWVYTPPGYPADAPYPTIYYHDGGSVVREDRGAKTLDTMILAGRIEPVIGVFVDPLDRRSEYRGLPEYVDFVAEELVPWVDSEWSTERRPRRRALVGGSRGALGALLVSWNRPDLFGLAVLLEPAITPTDALQQVFDAERRPVDFWLLGGLYDSRFIGDTYQALDTLRVKGYRARGHIAPIGHSPGSRRHFLPAILEEIFPPVDSEQ